MVKFTYERYDPEYDHEDKWIETTESNLRRGRNAHILLGFGLGVCSTFASQYVFLWIMNVV